MNPLIHSETPRDLKPRIALVVIWIALLMSDSLAQKVELIETYHMPLINVGSGKCFEPTPQGGPSVPIQQRTCSPRVIQPDGTNDRPIQYYQFPSLGHVAFNDQGWFGWLCVFGCIPAGTEGYFIRNQETDLCLDVRDGSKSDWAIVQQRTCDKNVRSMVWYVQPGDFPDVFKVRNFNSDLCLDVRGGSWDEYAQLQQYRCTSNNLAQNFSQKFLGLRMNLNGRWTDGSTRSAVISAGAFGHMVIDMSAFNRPAARGWFVLCCTKITVNFPDDATFTGEVSPVQVSPTKITWSNGSIWTKKP